MSAAGSTPASTHRRIQVGFVAASAVLLAISVASSVSLLGMRERAAEERAAQGAEIAVRRVVAAVTAAETGQRGYLLTGEPVYLEPLRAAGLEVARDLGALRAGAAAHPTLATRVDSLESAAELRLALLHRVADTRQTRGLDAARRSVAGGEGRAAMARMDALAASLERDLRRELAGHHQSALVGAARAMRVQLFSALLALAVIGGAYLAIRRSLTASAAAHRQLERYADELVRSNENLQAVVQSQQEVATIGLDREAAMRAVARRAMALTHASGAAIEALDGDAMVRRAASGILATALGDRLPAAASLSGLAARTRQVLRCDDTETDPRADRATARRMGVRSMIVVPLSGAEGGGVLKVVAAAPGAFSERDVSALQLLAGLMDAALRDAAAFEAEQVLLREAERYHQELERSNHDLQEFAYVASHDLQEPLRKIQAFGDRLRTRFAGSLDEQGLDYLGRMQAAAARMQNLIRDLLSLSRVATQGDEFVPVDLGTVAAEVIGDLGERIEASGGQIETGSLPVVHADPTQVRQLLQNLLGNALKYARSDVPPRVRIAADTVRGAVQVEISDNGIGFEQEYAERIFAPFQRLHGRGEYDGTGIGLAICRKIVERHGGEISARATPGDGATFRFTLPAKRARQAA